MPTRIVTGTASGEIIIGRSERDPNVLFDEIFYGAGGADVIYASGGNDWIWAAAGDPSPVIFYGGSGNDVLVGFDGADWLSGDDDDDLVIAGSGADNLSGGSGNDSLWGGAGVDTLIGGEGSDLLVGGLATETDGDWFSAGGGDDVAYGSMGNDTLLGGDAADWLFGFGGADILNGEAGNDTMLGGDGDDVIFDLYGNNLIAGGKGRDQITTGDGDDIIYSGGYRDFTPPRPTVVVNGVQIAGDPPEDPALFGVDSAITWTWARLGLSASGYWLGNFGMYIFEPPPMINPSGAGDYIAAGGGNDAIFSGDFDDIIFDGLGNDYVSPGGGENTLYMDGGLDTIVLTASTTLPFITFVGFAGNYGVSAHAVSNPDTLIYDRASSIGVGNVDDIQGFSVADGDKIRYLRTLGETVTWANDGNGDLLLSNADGVFAILRSVSAANFASAFEYFSY